MLKCCPRAIIHLYVQSAVQSNIEYLISLYSKNLSPSGLEMAGDHVCTLGQKTLPQHPKLLLLQLSGAKVQESQPFERKLVSNCRLREPLTYKKRSDKIKRCFFFLFSILWEKLSLGFIVLGTSFGHGDRSGQMRPSNTSVWFSSVLFDVLLGWERSNTHEDSIHWRLWRAGWQKTLQ